MLTGDVEVLINSVNVLNEADKDLPFSTADLSVPVSLNKCDPFYNNVHGLICENFKNHHTFSKIIFQIVLEPNIN